MNSKLELLLTLSYVKGVGPKKMQYITNQVSGLRELRERCHEIVQSLGLDERTRNNFSEFVNNFNIEETIFKYKDKGISIIITTDHSYPKLLQEIYDPPQILFCKGNLELLNNNNNIAMVGSRKATWYGKNIAKELSNYLSEAGYTVTSGMARGIDAEAHQGALKGKGRSIGVLGCGLDIIYPKQNERIYEEMEENGLIITAYPLGTPPTSGNFPARNRIISGLSKGVVVVEAQSKSGALITTDFAIQQGRDVFAVPGNINSSMSSGTNSLIKDGAIVVTKYSDVISEYDNNYPKRGASHHIELSTIEKKILECSGNQVFSLEHLVLVTGVDIAQILANLMTLEIKGLIKKVGNQMYQPMGKVDF